MSRFHSAARLTDVGLGLLQSAPPLSATRRHQMDGKVVGAREAETTTAAQLLWQNSPPTRCWSRRSGPSRVQFLICHPEQVRQRRNEQGSK